MTSLVNVGTQHAETFCKSLSKGSSVDNEI